MTNDPHDPGVLALASRIALLEMRLEDLAALVQHLREDEPEAQPWND